MTIAVLANPKARVFRDDHKAIESLYKVVSGRGLLIAPETPEALDHELTELRDADIQMIVFAGGDGTTSRMTDSLLRLWPHDALPPIGLLHAGTMNTISKSLGNRGTAEEQLEGLVSGKGITYTQRWPLQVGEGRYGYLFGMGIIPRYIQDYESGEPPTPRKAARVLAEKALSSLAGGEAARAFFEPIRADLTVDGRALPLKHWLILALGAVDDLGLRFRPFPGMLQQPGTMGMFASGSEPTAFVRDLLPIRFNRPVRHSLVFQQLATELRIRTKEPQPYNLDGDIETFEGELVVRSGPPVVFALPANAKQPANQLGP